MNLPECSGCRERDDRIVALEARLVELERHQRGSAFMRDEAKAERELRALQERAIERVGGSESIAVDVRVVAATHQDLSTAVARGRFRADLFFRLNVFPITVPSLRERNDDIPDLVRHFLIHFGRRLNKSGVGVGEATLRLLMGYSWPGNVRELENIIERAMIVTRGDMLQID